MKTHLPLSPLLLSLALLAGCGKPAAPVAPKTAAPAPAQAQTPADVPKVTGIIQDVLPERSSLVIKHEEIPGVMRAMTMAFRVDAATLQAAQKGQAITGDFSSSGMNFTLSNVKLGPAPTPSSTPPATQAATTTAQPAPAAAMPMPMNMPMGQGMPMMPGMDMPMPAAAPAQPAPAPAAPVTTAPQTPSPAQLAAGASVYNRICIACHQPTGAGLFPLFPPLAGSSIVTGDTRRLARILLGGLQGPVEVNGRTFNGVMPGLASQYSDDELAAVLTYVRNTWGNAAAPVPAAVLAAERASNRTTPWTWAELNQ